MAPETTKSGGQRNKPNARARAAAAREAQRKAEARRKMLTIGGITGLVLVIVAVIVIVGVTKGKSNKANSALRTTASATVVQQLTTIPSATFEAVGAGKVSGGPAKVSGPPLTAGGKPVFFYYGAEYCPYCGTERWAVVTALSRFGTWSDLKQTTSSSQDTPASIPTLSFYGAKFTSQYLAFQSVETTTNQLVNGSYPTLEKPTTAQASLVSKYDNGGSIPFLDFGNKYTSSGATYDYSVLQGKSPDEIASQIRDASTDTSKGVLGAANSITAAICNMTNGQPGSVCNLPQISKLRTALDK